MEYTEFWTILSSNGIVLNVEQIESFKRYERELIYWNEKVNLISRKDTANILERHFLHSLAILKYIDLPQKARCLDIGTGGGFPGLPLKIAHPNIFMILTDSIRKKITTTEIFAKHTGLRNIECKCCRVEELGNNKQYIQHFDIITARAVAPIVELMDWAMILLKPKGKFVFLKGGDMTDEIEFAKKKHPNYTYEQIEIDLLGCSYFKDEAKKILKIGKN
jgi:16S rRNA (guanine527-N7)-methyltransferase